MEREQIEQMAESMMQMALDNLERDGYVAFATLLVTKQKRIMPILLERVDAEQKERLGAFLRVLASTGDYDVIAIISEAWTLDSSKENAFPLQVPVSEHPDRVEGVFVHMASRHGDLMLTTRFKRDNGNNPIRPREISSAWQPGLPSSNFGGIFVNVS